MHAADATATTPLQWGLACVRSRAFQLTQTLFAAVPFADLANHSTAPNARLVPVLDGADAIQTGSTENWVVMRAAEDIAAGDEVTVSYTGAAGATNRRLLVQYGFVLPGNEADRLDFELFDGYVGTTPLRGAPYAPLLSGCIALPRPVLREFGDFFGLDSFGPPGSQSHMMRDVLRVDGVSCLFDFQS